MSQNDTSAPNTPQPAQYSLGYSDSIHQWMSQRTAATNAAFLLPHLRSGMRLPDCGCGPGSITLGLADAVAPGEAVGIDIEPVQIERAQALAQEQGVSNVRFEIAGINSLPFPDESFDTVFAHAVLYHLPDPLDALRECVRVLKPGGVIGVRDTDYSVWLLEPATPVLDTFRELSLKVAAFNGASPTYARQQRSLLAQAGCTTTSSGAKCISRGSADATATAAQTHIARLENTAFQSVAIQQGWAAETDLAQMADELRGWGARPDAFEVVMWRESVGWTAPLSTE